jgi:hypothetical protein
MKKLDKLKKEILAKSKGKGKRELITFDRSCYRKTLSTTMGFGAQDLKPVYFDLYMWMCKKFGQNMVVTLVSLSEMTVNFSLK